MYSKVASRYNGKIGQPLKLKNGIQRKKRRMSVELDNDIYCASIAVVLIDLLRSGEEAAKLQAKDMAESYGVISLEAEYINSAQSIADNLSKTDHSKEEILRYLTLYIKFLRNYNSDFSKKSFFGRTFRGNVFGSPVINNPDQAISRITAFILRCLSGTAEQDWFR